MTTKEKLLQRKMTLLELAKFLDNVSVACRVNGVSRQHYYDIKEAYEKGGMDALRERVRPFSNKNNRVSEEIENACVQFAFDHPECGPHRVAAELRKKGLLISQGGVRCVWKRHGLETFQKRLVSLEVRSAESGVVLTEKQKVLLESLRDDQAESIDHIETQHPGYLLGQDTFYVGFLKGVGRIYQQTVIDTYSRVGFAKLYTNKMPVTAADLLNDRVLPFFAQYEVPVLRMLTDRGTEFCGRPGEHPYEVFLEFNEVDHSRTKAYSPQTNGITERFQQTVLREFYMVAFRRKIYADLESLQVDLDAWLVEYNNSRPHQGIRCHGKTPMQTFLEGMPIVREKMLPTEVAVA